MGVAVHGKKERGDGSRGAWEGGQRRESQHMGKGDVGPVIGRPWGLGQPNER
jgi:hypothetical protein